MRAALLASRVRARYVRHEALVHSPAMSLVARAAPVTLQSMHQHGLWLRWAPRLHFLLERDAAPRAWPRATGDTAAHSVGRCERLETVVRRIVSRCERVETTAAPASAPEGLERPSRERVRSEAPTISGAIARVFQKPPRAVVPSSVTSASPVPASAALAETARWPGWPPARSAATAPPVDVERLTDQVMNTIGRRMAAHRERRGR